MFRVVFKKHGLAEVSRTDTWHEKSGGDMVISVISASQHNWEHAFPDPGFLFVNSNRRSQDNQTSDSRGADVHIIPELATQFFSRCQNLEMVYMDVY